MGFAQRLAWFSSPPGRICVQSTVVTVGILSGTPYFLMHTFLQDYYKDFVQMYQRAVGVPVPKHVMAIYDTVVKDMKLTDLHKHFLTPFTVFGFDMFHAGSTETNSGALIGIPINLSFESPMDVPRAVKVQHKAVDWESEVGTQLQESLILPENAKKFAIAREIAHVQTYEIHLKSLFPSIIILGLYFTNTFINRRFNTFKGPLSNRLIIYTLTSLFGYANYCFLQDLTTVHYEFQADDKASDINKDYIQGGIEFYEKMLSRNQALRSLMGKDGEKLYSLTGNENFFIRQTHLPTFGRKTFLEQKLKSFDENKVLTKEEKEKYILGIKVIEEHDLKPSPTVFDEPELKLKT